MTWCWILIRNKYDSFPLNFYIIKSIIFWCCLFRTYIIKFGRRFSFWWIFHSLCSWKAILWCWIHIDCLIFSCWWKMTLLSIRNWSISLSKIILSSFILKFVLIKGIWSIFLELIWSNTWLFIIIVRLYTIAKTIMRIFMDTCLNIRIVERIQCL